ncbi:MAG: hypothetical protein M1343_08275 [Chloroflexi bacterium]|nr:hypothetical protein [Chloroflexota bacterium]
MMLTTRTFEQIDVEYQSIRTQLLESIKRGELPKKRIALRERYRKLGEEREKASKSKQEG